MAGADERSLVLACLAGDLSTVKSSVASLGATALSCAVEIEVKPTVHRYRTCLSAASGTGAFDVVKLLLDKQADVNQNFSGFSRSRKVCPAVYIAGQEGHAPIIELLLGKKASPDEIVDGYTVLHVACMKGHCSAAEVHSAARPTASQLQRTPPPSPESRCC
jgi:ankyrin repeat protein